MHHNLKPGRLKLVFKTKTALRPEIANVIVYERTNVGL